MSTDTPADASWVEQLSSLDARGLLRRLREVESAQGPYVTVGGRRFCCFSSNNYLGLANHPHVIAATKAALDEWGWGAGASRLVTGHMSPHTQLETRLAAFKGTQAALVTSTGYQANLAAIRAVVGRQQVVLIDKLVHGSIVDAALGSGAIVRVFPHRDYDKLERLLERTGQYRRRVIVTDSVFSMDGDFADLLRLVEIKQRHGAMLMIDEAHATGVLGERGRGLAELAGVEHAIDIVVGTLSKALGGIGGFICGSTQLIEWIINTAGPFIYTTALPPAACAAAVAALEIVEREPQRRERLLQLAGRLRRELAEVRGWDIAGSMSHIVPLVVGEAAATVALAERLREEGLLVVPIRPPTVPRGAARLRISLCCEHTDADVDRLVAALDKHFTGNAV